MRGRCFGVPLGVRGGGGGGGFDEEVYADLRVSMGLWGDGEWWGMTWWFCILDTALFGLPAFWIKVMLRLRKAGSVEHGSLPMCSKTQSHPFDPLLYSYFIKRSRAELCDPSPLPSRRVKFRISFGSLPFTALTLAIWTLAHADKRAR